MSERTGGCQCGRVRHVVDVGEAEAYLCHCTMCRRATGGASIAFIGVPVTAVRFAREPDWYRSSPIAERPFCSACGTPLGFRFMKDAQKMDLTLGALDDPSGFSPAHNYATESILPGWQDTAHLPGIRSDDNPNIADRWIEAVGKLPD